MPAKLSSAEVINRSIGIHGDKFTYSIENGNVIISCPKHGVLNSILSHHLNGVGCRKCSYESMSMTFDKFVLIANEKHSNKYTYTYKHVSGVKTIMPVTCKDHGLFNISVTTHLNGGGCPKCTIEKARPSFQDYIKKAIAIHGDKYLYPAQEILPGLKSKIKVICKKHGEFSQGLYSHLNGAGCKHCSDDSKRLRFEDFVDAANKIHENKYTYPEQEIINARAPIKIICDTHGEFMQSPNNHTKPINAHGCTRCSFEKISKNMRHDYAEVIRLANEAHNYAYNYPDYIDSYKDTSSIIPITCKKHGEFLKSARSHINGVGCPSCATGITSETEKEVFNYFKQYNPEANFKLNVKGIRKHGIENKRSAEIDIFFKDKMIGVELNGLYWHSYDRVGSTYHLDKLKACNNEGIDLIQVYEDEWLDKPDIVKSIINSRLGVYEKRIYARNTKLVEISASLAGAFYDSNHIQGKVGANKHYGLMYDGIIVACASFGNRQRIFKGADSVELIRFCNKINYQVVGGLSKLIKPFEGVTLRTFCDLRLFNGNGYKSAGFNALHESKPGYYYVKSLKRYSRFKFQKHKLKGQLNTYDESITEVKNMEANGYWRIFDCGNIVLEKPASMD